MAFLILTADNNYASPPVSLANVKLHLGIEYSDDDTRLTDLIWSAVDYIERNTGKTFSPKTYSYILPAFPPFLNVYNDWQKTYATAPMFQNLGVQWFALKQRIELPRNPIATINSITYYDTTNTQQTLSSGDYYLVTPDIGYSVLESTTSFPTTYIRPDAVTISFTTKANTPYNFIMCVKNLVAFYNENREGGDIPKGIDALINSMRDGDYK